MSNFKMMKIRVTDANREAVKAALLAEGYEPTGRMAEVQMYNRAIGYYTYSDDYVLCSDADSGEDYFERHENPEYILSPFGTLVKASDYYKQPETEYTKRFPCKGCRPGECVGCGDDVPEKVYEPLPLQPFNQWAIDRMKLLAQHIAHQLDKGQAAEQSLVRQLHVLNTLCIECEKEGM